MPKKQKNSLTVQADQQESDSVLDFLYQDVRRVGSYLAQLTPAGHVQSVKQTTSTEETGEVNSKGSASASIAVARIMGDVTTHAGNKNQDTLEKIFDPLWTNAVDLLTLLEAQHLIRRRLCT